APLIRVGLIKLAEQHHVLMVDVHHIIADGISQNHLIKEFIPLYNGEILNESALQYKDYAEWQLTQEQAIADQKAYWLNEFVQPIEPLQLPADFQRSISRNFAGDTISFELDKDTLLKLKKLQEREKSTMFVLLFAVYYIWMSKLSNQEDIVIGIPTAGRQHPDLEDMVGMFVNILPIRNFPKGDVTFKEFLATVQSRSLAAFDNQSYPYEELINELKVVRDTTRNPLFDVVF